MPSGFLVNYGGPGLSTFSSSSRIFDQILDACKKQYGGKPEATAFTIQGLNLTYYEIGVHRMIKVELPESVSEALKSPEHNVRQTARKTQALYLKAKARAGDFDTKKYGLVSNNCVSAVANVLNILDPSILGQKNKIVPIFLDEKIKSYTALSRKIAQDLSAQDYKTMEKDIKIEQLQSGGVPSEIWSDVMSTPAQRQQEMKAKLAALKDEARVHASSDEEEEDKTITPDV